MGMPVLTIDRELEPGLDGAETRGVLTGTAAKSTPTFLSVESLTFPGFSVFALGFVQIWGKATGEPANPMEILGIAGILGVLLIVWGLLGITNTKRSWQTWVGQVIVGLLNTALLYGVMLGVTVAAT